MKLRAIVALVGLLCIAVGVGFLWAWPAGLAVAGLLLWLDMEFGKQ